MSRIHRSLRVDSRSARQKLRRRPEPYWHKISRGFYLGYRKGSVEGTWTARIREHDGHQKYKVLGAADDLNEADAVKTLSFDQAQELARLWLVERSSPPSLSEHYTVQDCMLDYLEWVRQHRKSFRHLKTYINAFILPHFHNIEANALTASMIRKWQNLISEEAPRLRTKRGAVQQHREEDANVDEARRKRRLRANRHLTTLKAALNRGWREGRIKRNDEWIRVQKYPSTERSRQCILTKDEARRLLNACPHDLRNLVQLALSSGARFSELIKFRVADFDPSSERLYVRDSKSGKSRYIVLNDEGVAFCKSLVLGRADAEFMVQKCNGEPWAQDHQHRPFRDAIRAARLNSQFTFHGLRHTYASLMIMNGAPLLAVAHNLGHRDTRMVEQHYGHLTETYLASAIKNSAPNFAEMNRTNVVAIG